MVRTLWKTLALLSLLLSACTPPASARPIPLQVTATPTRSGLSPVKQLTQAASATVPAPTTLPTGSLAAATALAGTQPTGTQPTAVRPTATRRAAPPATATRPASSTPSKAQPGQAAPIGPAPTPPACLKAGGRIAAGSLETSLLRLPLVFRVYLPPCYDQEPERSYPVLYLFHGQSFNDDQWDRMGADETADRLIAAGEIPPFLIVMPFERYGGQPTETKFDQAFMEVLLPYIEDTYRTIPDRRHRATGGLSRGAGWAVHFGIWKADAFGAVGAHSPAVFHTDAQRMRTWLQGLAPDGFPHLYVDIGERDRPEILRSADWFVKLLNEFDVPHEWHLFTGYHNEEYWSSHMEQYLRWYSQDW